MRYFKRSTPLGLLAAAAVLAGCGGAVKEEATSAPARVEHVKGSDAVRVILTPEAARRLGIRTAPVQSDGRDGRRLIPYSAVLYDADGRTWTYTNPRPLVFVRRDIAVDGIVADRALLSNGPLPGTRVVTVGATELWGVEYGGIEED
jgi:hypothetical protein